MRTKVYILTKRLFVSGSIPKWRQPHLAVMPRRQASSAVVGRVSNIASQNRASES